MDGQQTDGWPDGQPENMMPVAGREGIKTYITQLH